MDTEVNIVKQDDQQFKKLTVMQAKSKTALKREGADWDDDDFARVRLQEDAGEAQGSAFVSREGPPSTRASSKRSCKSSAVFEAVSRPNRAKTAASAKVGVGLNAIKQRQRAAREMAAADRSIVLAELTLTDLQAHNRALNVSSATMDKLVNGHQLSLSRGRLRQDERHCQENEGRDGKAVSSPLAQPSGTSGTRTAGQGPSLLGAEVLRSSRR